MSEIDQKDKESRGKPQPPKVMPMEVLQKNTPEDDKMMALVRKRYGKDLDLLQPDVIYRFVRGYAHEAEREKATFERMDHFFARFKEYKFQTILDEDWDEEEKCLGAWTCYMYGTDHQGHPVMYDEIGSCDVTKVEKAFNNDMEKLRKFRFRFMTRVGNRKNYLSQKYGMMIYKHTMVMDLSGFTRHHFGSQYRQLVKDIIGEEQHLFPESLCKLYIINAPWAFRLIWNILSVFIDPITVKKIDVLGGSFLPEMLKLIDKDQIPKKFGGNGKLGDIIPGHDCEDFARLKEEKKRKKDNPNKDANSATEQKDPGN